MEKKESSQEKTFYQSFEDNCMISTSHKENTLKLLITNPLIDLHIVLH